ncbi:MAG: hypothetical protein KHZ58_16795 [Hungatella hathewayi]|nr:hypothetical protein [Hungatella hathewayi]
MILKNGNNNIVQRIQPIRQTGSNCGMYAMAMALADLSGLDGHWLAAGLETYAIENGLSALGEAFDAEELARAGRGYCEQTCPAIPLVFRVLEFTTQQEMTAILNQSLLGKVYVLIPYLTNDRSAMPARRRDGEGAVATPTEMTYAHWSVVEDSGTGDNRIFEGNQDSYEGGSHTLTESRQEDLFQANQRLGNSLDWSEYIGDTHRYLKASGAHDRNFHDMVNWGRSQRIGTKIQFGEEWQIREDVNLRGRAIMVGYSAAVGAALASLKMIAPGVL